EGSFCPFCVAWYGINLIMGLCAYKAWSIGDRGSLLQVLRDALGRPGAAAVATAVLGVSMGYGGYLLRRHTVLIGVANATLDRILEDETPVALDLEGLPSEGSEDAPITVVEVADFECPFCRELWDSIRWYSDNNPSKVRVVFVHYPVDDSCNPRVKGVHPQACRAARAAQCAHRYDAFFEYGDLLFDNQPAFGSDDLVDYATQLGLPEDEFRACLDDETTAQQVAASIARASRLGVQTTPTFFVNGYKFGGSREYKWVKLVFDGLARRDDDYPGAPG
ncbi:MAG: thioredoxin domain-containing protein, partial [Nannocystaceae bacterium]